MGFETKRYTIKVPELAPLHRSMKEFGAAVDSFEFEFEGVRTSALFFIDSDPFRIVLYKHGLGQRLELNVVRGYRVEFLRSEEEAIASFFEIPKGGLRGRLFVRIAAALGRQAPNEWRPLDSVSRRRVAAERNVDEKDKTYFSGLRVWPAINARTKGKKCHRTDANLKKVRLLDPEIYEDIKDFDISVCYSSDPAKMMKWSGLDQMARHHAGRIERMR